MPAITREDIRRYAGEINGFFKREAVDSAKDLMDLAGESFPARNPRAQGERIEIEMRPSTNKTLAIALSYIVPGTGIPIDARINSKPGYSLMILKLNQLVDGYKAFAGDGQGNLRQERSFNPGEFPEIRKELERLSSSE